MDSFVPDRPKKTRYILPAVIAVFIIGLALFVLTKAQQPPVGLVRIVDEMGKPVAGARITPDGLLPKGGNGHYTWTDRHPVKPLAVTTNMDGLASVPYPRYAEEALEVGSISFRLEHPDFCSARPIAEVDASPSSRSPWQAKLKYLFQMFSRTPKPSDVIIKRGATWLISASTSGGQRLLADLHVQTTGVGLNYAVTNWFPAANGALECRHIIPGSNWLRVVYLPAQGERLFSEPLLAPAVAGQTNRFNLSLHPGVRVNGWLADVVPRPIAKGVVKVRAFAGGKADQALTWTTMTKLNPDGSFSFSGLPAGRLEFIALCNGFVSENTLSGKTSNMQYPQSHSVTEGKFDFELPMEPTASCWVKVIDENGQPLPGAQLNFWPNERWGEWYSTGLGYPGVHTAAWLRHGSPIADPEYRELTFGFDGKTDELGVVVISNLPGHTQRLLVNHSQFEMPIRKTPWGSEYRGEEAVLTPGETNYVTVRMQKKRGKALSN